ncbi:hypothetical protein Msil_3513 [Methylocella silvestris BL2]|uniref:Uncharacterized protein n=1 Tax=Methylocella silvestris (strain DSM 15510 / CIP 108128 / LMG 27833 / NCIMB 13906 / BL2) TaxID=395965 RepID=B8ETQ0_METSB|nr:hypothetical protein [Methylocella silvestris]ACK52402.1 hypothetical protein Msil_3513 [Methylocella silvestris BL2]
MAHVAIDDDGAATGFSPRERRRAIIQAKGRGWTRFIAVAALAAIAFGCLVAFYDQEKEGPRPREARIAAQAGWVVNRAAPAMFRVAAPDGAREPTSHEIRVRAGGGRQDIFVFGDINGDGPIARLTLIQQGEANASASPFFVALARMAAEAGRSVALAAQPAALPTRLGVFEAAEASLSRSGGGASKCVGFRNIREAASPQEASLSVAGFACAASEPDGAAPAMGETAACLIDAIELLPGIDDPGLAAAFAERDLRQTTACAGQAEEFGAPVLRKSLDHGFSLSAR